MNIIKFIGTLSVIGYILGILYNFVDFSYTQKAIRLTAALYIITALISPLEYSDFNIDIDSLQLEVYSRQESVEFVLESAAAQLEQKIKNILDEKNIAYTDISVHINKQSEKISVDYIEIYGVLPGDKKLISGYLSDIGTVVFGDENGY